jgi:glycosyltransferase involved in cell wall biosynthesis
LSSHQPAPSLCSHLESYPRPELRILILNWRCPRNPRAGGAETLTFEIARRLVLLGHSVEWFSAGFPGAPATELMEGIRVVRAGRQWSVHLHAFARYRTTINHLFDVVIDEVNTVPFFTPLWARGTPKLMLIFQLAREVWWYESPLPVALMGFLLEPIYLKAYRNTTVLTISYSTEGDLRGLGFRSQIIQVPVGIPFIHAPSAVKAAEPTFLYVGRISPSKRIPHLITALAQFRKGTASGTLWIVGSGSDGCLKSLKALARRLGVERNVVFWGRVTTAEKERLMSEAHALLMASVREGWGLVVTEAGACGTPAIVYDVPGLRDSVRHESTGLVVGPQPALLTEAMVRIIGSDGLGDRLGRAAQSWSSNFSYEKAVQSVSRALSTTTMANSSGLKTKA